MILSTDLSRPPNDMLTTVLSSTAEALAKSGATIDVNGDFSRYTSANRNGALAFGGFNPMATNATRGSSTIISVDGEVVATGATALYETYERSMADLIDEIDIYRLGHDRLTLNGDCREWLSAIQGRVLFSGGIWVRKDFRKTPLSRLAVPLLLFINRVVGVYRWNAGHIVSIQEVPVVTKGIADRYRMWAMAEGALWHLNGKEIPMVFGYAPPVQAIMDAQRVARQGMEHLVLPLKRSANVGSSQRGA